MAYDTNNIFAKILRGEIPCIKLFEDEHTLAFMDIMPQADGHVLVLPKEGAAELFDLSDDAASAAIRVLARVLTSIASKVSLDGPSNSAIRSISRPRRRMASIADWVDE